MKEKLKEYGFMFFWFIGMALAFMILSQAFRELLSMIGG